MERRTVAPDSERSCKGRSQVSPILYPPRPLWLPIVQTCRRKSPQPALFHLLLDATHAMNGRAKEPHDQLSLHTIQ